MLHTRDLPNELTIGELAAAAGVPTSTIRYYERTRLLSASARSPANYRLYSPGDLERLRFIRAAQATGFKLEDVSRLLQPAPCGSVQQLIEERLGEVSLRMKELRHLQKLLRGALDECREVKAAWARGYENQPIQQINRSLLGLSALVRGIARRGVITPDEFSRSVGLGLEDAGALFAGFAEAGMDMDDGGNIIGAVLTAKPTPHGFLFNGTKRYAWCALDTLFLPGLLGPELLDGVAEVESTCPVTKRPVRLEVAPEGVASVDPAETVISVVLPGIGSDISRIGLASPT